MMKLSNQANTPSTHSFQKRTNPNPPVRVLDMKSLKNQKPSECVEISCGLCQHRFERPMKPESVVLVCPSCGVRFEHHLPVLKNSQHHPRTLEEKILSVPSSAEITGQGVERICKQTQIEKNNEVKTFAPGDSSGFSDSVKRLQNSSRLQEIREKDSEDLTISFRQKRIAAASDSDRPAKTRPWMPAQQQITHSRENYPKESLEQFLRPGKNGLRSLWNTFSHSTLGAMFITLAQSLLIVAALIGVINGMSLLFIESRSSSWKNLSQATPQNESQSSQEIFQKHSSDAIDEYTVPDSDRNKVSNRQSKPGEQRERNSSRSNMSLPGGKENLEPVDTKKSSSDDFPLPLFTNDSTPNETTKAAPSQKIVNAFKTGNPPKNGINTFSQNKTAQISMNVTKSKKLPLFNNSEGNTEYINISDFDDSSPSENGALPITSHFVQSQQLLKTKLDESQKKVQELEQRYEKSLMQKDQIQQQSKRLVSETLLRESVISLEKNPPRSLILSLKSIRMLYELGDQVSELGKLVLAHAYAAQSTGVSFLEHIPLVLTHSVSRSGNWLLTANADRSLWIWDLSKTGGKKPSQIGYRIDTTPVPLVQLLLTPDERWVVGARSDGLIEMWNMALDHPSEAAMLLNERIPGLCCIEITPDGRWLIAYGNSKKSQTHPSAAQQNIQMVGNFSNDKNEKSETGCVWMWDLDVLKQENQEKIVPQALVLRGDNQPVQCLAVSPNSRWLATGNADTNIRVYDLMSAYPGANQRILRGHQLEITAIHFSENGRWIATGSRDNTVRIWDLSEHVPNPNSYVLNAHNGWISSLALSADGQWFVSAGYDQTVRIWNMQSVLERTSEKESIFLAPEQGVVRKVEFSPDSSALITYGTDKSVKIWNIHSESAMDRPIRLPEEVSSYNFGGKGRWLLLTRHQGNRTTVSLWPMRVEDLFQQASHFVKTALPTEVHQKEEIYANQFESRLVR